MTAAETGSKWVVLQTCGDNAEAAMLRGLLDVSGIPCMVQGEQHRSMLGTLGGYVDLRVLVPLAELDRAREVLTQGQAEAEAALDAEALSAGGADVVVLHQRSERPEDWRAQRRRRFGWITLGIFFGPGVIGILLAMARGCGG